MPYSRKQLINITHGSATGIHTFSSICDFPVDEIVFRCFYAVLKDDPIPVLAYSSLIANKTIPCFCIGNNQFLDVASYVQSDNGTNQWRHEFANPLGVNGEFQIELRTLTGDIPNEYNLAQEDILVEIEFISKSKYLYK